MIKCHSTTFFFFQILFILSGILTNCFGQIGLKTPQPIISYSMSDSIDFGFPKPVLPLRDWHDQSYQYMELNFDKHSLNILQFISPGFIPDNPFLIDTRGSSLYVPRRVRDELNLIMNRPKDTAFVPILPVAYLVLQMASQYLLIQNKTEIRIEDINASREAIPLLKALWIKSPQTLTELFQDQEIADSFTFRKTEIYIDMLADNKLVRPKKIGQNKMIYYPAINEDTYNMIIENAKQETNNKPDSKKTLKDTNK